MSDIKDSISIGDDNKLIGLFKNALSLNSKEFTDEERNVISNISSSDLRTTYSNPTLTASDLSAFHYSDNMFDNLPRSTSSTNSNSDNTSSTKIVSSSEIDFSHPEVDTPALDSIPTASDILSPFKKILPQLQNLNISNVQCPTWSFEIWDKSFVIDSHCPLIDEHRVLIQLLFSIFWAFVALYNLLDS